MRSFQSYFCKLTTWLVYVAVFSMFIAFLVGSKMYILAAMLVIICTSFAAVFCLFGPPDQRLNHSLPSLCQALRDSHDDVSDPGDEPVATISDSSNDDMTSHTTVTKKASVGTHFLPPLVVSVPIH